MIGALVRQLLSATQPMSHAFVKSCKCLHVMTLLHKVLFMIVPTWMFIVLVVTSEFTYSYPTFPYQITWEYKHDYRDLKFKVTANITQCDGGGAAAAPDIAINYSHGLNEPESDSESDSDYIETTSIIDSQVGNTQTYDSNQLFLILHGILNGSKCPDSPINIQIAELPLGLISGTADTTHITLSNVKKTNIIFDDQIVVIQAKLIPTNIYTGGLEWQLAVIKDITDDSYTIELSLILGFGTVTIETQAPEWFALDSNNGLGNFSMTANGSYSVYNDELGMSEIKANCYKYDSH